MAIKNIVHKWHSEQLIWFQHVGPTLRVTIVLHMSLAAVRFKTCGIVCCMFFFVLANCMRLAQAVEALGAGELLLNCIDRDGQGTGYELELINQAGPSKTQFVCILLQFWD